MHGWRVDRALHNYLYFTQYDRYVKAFLEGGRSLVDKLGRFPLAALPFKIVSDRYHGKVLSESDVTKILTLDKSVDFGPDTSERVVPFKYANKIILSEPDYIAVMDCPCRLSREAPCEPVNVCIAVGRTTAQFWIEHGERLHARKISQEEALGIIKSERDKGRITTAWFKVATGARTGVLCSCCKCCCGGLEGMRLMQSIKGAEKLTNIIPSGYAVERRADACEGCGRCAEVCMFDAAEADDTGKLIYHKERCMGCGLCVDHCPREARSLYHDPEIGDPLDLDFIAERMGKKQPDRM